MSWILLVAAVVVVLAFVVAAAVVAQKKGNGKDDGFPYQKNKALFSPAERSFLGVLEQAVASEYRVFGKVRIADVASVKSNSDRAAWQRAFNRISAKHFDFVLCRPGDLSVVCAIELDDQSHEQGKRKERDSFVADLCKAISLPLLQVPAKQAYSVQALRERLSPLIETDGRAGKLDKPVREALAEHAAGEAPPR